MNIQVLGNAWARDAHGANKPLERKVAALLAYLALEGATPRERLVGLLWPDTEGQTTALNNLRQVLSRLRRQTEVDYVQGGDLVGLREGLTVDALELLKAHQARDFARVVSFEGKLLQSFNYDDEDFTSLNEWLERWRMRLGNLRLEAMEQQVLQPEEAGHFKEALEKAWRLLEWDLKLESSYRHVMRLHYRLGDRAAALKAYRQCQEMLRQEFDAGPSEETRALARQIERVDVPPARPVVPLSVDHPPVLAGREREWALMEAAWAERKPMIVDGESGVGKSRLVRDFGHSRGRCLLVEARPGDQQSRYATHIRSLGKLVRDNPDAPMAPWVRRELARLVPGLQDDAPPLPQSPEERMRLCSAVVEFLRIVLEDVQVIVFDDAQYLDRDSAELGIQIHRECHEEMIAGRFPLIINVFRTSEAGDWEQKQIQSVIESGLMRRVKVDRLEAPAVRQMLEGMGAPELSPEQLMNYTGGNPLFIVEMVRHLRQAGSVGGKIPEDLPPPERIRLMVQQRLERLSEESLRLARFFAVARTDFSAALASKVLELPVDRLAAPWKELEQAEIIRSKGAWFTHDLMGEVLLATLPEPIREELARRIELHRPSR